MSILAKLLGRKAHPQPKLDLSHPLVIELSRELRALDALPISTKAERIVWSDAARSFLKKLRTDWASIYDSLPYELEHYLVDADIRAKDPGYTTYQRKLLAELLTPEETEPNQAPEPTPTTVTPPKKLDSVVAP
jgi:hypothetical protein